METNRFDGFLRGLEHLKHPDEQLVLIERAQEGDTAARNALVSMNLRLIRKDAFNLAHRAGYRQGMDPEDLFQEGAIGMMRGIPNYDPDKGASVPTFLRKCAWGYMRTAMRRLEGPNARSEGRRVNLESLSPREHYTFFGKTLAGALEVRAERAQKDLDSALEQLSEREREVIKGRSGLYGPKEIQLDLSRRLGIHAETVRRIEDRAQEKLLKTYAPKLRDQLDLWAA